MSPSLRFKINSVIVLTVISTALIFGGFFLPFQKKQRQASRDKIVSLLHTLILREHNPMANEIFERRVRALEMRLAEIHQIEGVISLNVFTGEGLLLASTDNEPMSQSPAPIPGLTASSAPLVAEVIWRGEPAISYTKVLSAAGEKIGVVQVRYSLAGIVREQRQFLFFFGCFLVVLLFIMLVLSSMLMSRAVLEPIRRLRETMIEVEEAGPGGQVRITTRDEIGDLARVFNRMSDALAASYGKIERQQSALKESRQKLSAHIEQTPVGAMTFDLDFRITEWNPAAERIFGYPAAEAIGHRPTDLIVPGPVQKQVENIFGSLVTTQGGTRSTNENVTKQGRCIICEWYNSVLTDIEGNVTGAASLVHNITARHEAQRKLKASLAEKDVLLREVHHRVKNNLQTIISLLRIRAGSIGPDDRNYGELITDLQNRIWSMALIHEKLYKSKDLAHISFGDYVVSLATELVASADSANKRITLKTDVDEILLELDSAIPCGMIVSELVSNSLKHAFPDITQGELMISLHAIADDEIELTAKDNGIGMPSDPEPQNNGTVGLELAKTLTEHQLGGKLRIDTANGTTHTIRFRRHGYARRV